MCLLFRFFQVQYGKRCVPWESLGKCIWDPIYQGSAVLQKHMQHWQPSSGSWDRLARQKSTLQLQQPLIPGGKGSHTYKHRRAGHPSCIWQWRSSSALCLVDEPALCLINELCIVPVKWTMHRAWSMNMYTHVACRLVVQWHMCIMPLSNVSGHTWSVWDICAALYHWVPRSGSYLTHRTFPCKQHWFAVTLSYVHTDPDS